MRRVPTALSSVLLLLLTSGCATEFVRVSIESNPTSAEVWMGGVHKDSTPCTLLFEDEGTFELLVKKPGYLSVKKLVTVFEQKDLKDEPYLVVNPDRMTVTLDPAEPGAAPGSPSTDGAAPSAPGTTKPYYQ